MYYPDPVDTIRKLMRHVRPEGLIVFQELDMANARSLPIAPLFERSLAWIKQTLSATGAQIQLGLELYPVFLAERILAPSQVVVAIIVGSNTGTRYDIFTVKILN